MEFEIARSSARFGKGRFLADSDHAFERALRVGIDEQSALARPYYRLGAAAQDPGHRLEGQGLDRRGPLLIEDREPTLSVHGVKALGFGKELLNVGWKALRPGQRQIARGSRPDDDEDRKDVGLFLGGTQGDRPQRPIGQETAPRG